MIECDVYLQVKKDMYRVKTIIWEWRLLMRHVFGSEEGCIIIILLEGEKGCIRLLVFLITF